MLRCRYTNHTRSAQRLLATLAIIVAQATTLPADDLSASKVLNSIERGKAFLVSHQNGGGSWTASRGGDGVYKIGISSLSLLALINAGMTVDDRPVQKALTFLRSVPEVELKKTYEIALMIMALANVKDGVRDTPRIGMLAQKLESSQISRGSATGAWGYGDRDTSGDRSNTQFAILGLRDAAHAGIAISRDTWKRARMHWLLSQNPDGGWGYTSGAGSTGSMTVAGVASLVITESMLQDDKDVNPDGTPICCSSTNEERLSPLKGLQGGLNWLSRRFQRGANPGSRTWLLYYLYGMERAGRLSGQRFFGEHDWYREVAEFLISRQGRRGEWIGVGGLESDPMIGTSFALLFLSKGLAPVLINKLEYVAEGDDQTNSKSWNAHNRDISNLTDHISGLPKWPKLLTWQVLDLKKAVKLGDVNVMLQSPILYITGYQRPKFLDSDNGQTKIAFLREYISQGGFIFAVNGCNSVAFHDGFLELIEKMYPNGEATLKPLPVEHPIYRSEYLFRDPGSVELHGVDFGCRTAIVYSPDDLGCLWNKWARQDPPNRSDVLQAMIKKNNRVGVNVVAYATGREPPNKLHSAELASEAGAQDTIERGFLQIAKLRHTGGWDAAPQALRNLLLALNRTVGMAASTKQRNLPATDPNLFKYPVLYMHGRHSFGLGQQEKQQLQKYLRQGGLLFADACCGSSQFDRSFRELMRQIFPGQQLTRIPADHLMFSSEVGYDIREVQRRAPEARNQDVAVNAVLQLGEPFLEGIQVEGRYVAVYSKYDISCALERQRSVVCAGYDHQDAVRIAINVVLYAMMQDFR